jgi:hypothetical protein
MSTRTSVVAVGEVPVAVRMCSFVHLLRHSAEPSGRCHGKVHR